MSRILKVLIATVIIFLFQTTTYADPANDSLNQQLKNIRSMKSDFSQTIIDKKGKLIQKSHGRMALQRPGKFRWETTAPTRQLVVATGSKLSIYDPDLEQVVIRGLSKQAGQTPALMLSDANPILETDFNVKTATVPGSNLQWYVLSPKDRSSMFASIRMGFQGGQLREMQLRDHLEHTTTIQFTNSKYNGTLPSALFNFAPPKNVDVIDETKK